MDGAPTAARLCTREHTRTHTRICTHTGHYVQGCASAEWLMEGALGVLSLVPVPLIPHLSALWEIEVPVPCGHPPCLPRLPGARLRCSPGTKPWEPPFRQPPGPPMGGLCHRGPVGALVGGGTLSSQNHPQPHGEETSLGRDFLCGHRKSEHLSLSWQASGWACSQHPSFHRLYELLRAQGPVLLSPPSCRGQIHACLCVGLEGDRGVRVPLGLRHRLTAHPLGYRVAPGFWLGAGLGRCVCWGDCLPR